MTTQSYPNDFSRIVIACYRVDCRILSFHKKCKLNFNTIKPKTIKLNHQNKIET